jgi:hypothetical protein
MEEELAAVACALEQPEPAARMFGAAHALREAIGAPVPPVPPADQAAYERDVSLARARLGAAPFAAAWAHSRKAPPELVVADTLQAMATTAPQMNSVASVRARPLRQADRLPKQVAGPSLQAPE